MSRAGSDPDPDSGRGRARPPLLAPAAHDSTEIPALAALPRYGVAQARGPRASQAWWLVSLEDPDGTPLPVPEAFEPAAALLAPPLALALWVWERARLELGEAAAVAAGHPLSPLLAWIAVLRGGFPVLQLGGRAGAEHVEVIDPAGPDAADRLAGTLAARPGAALVDPSGRPEVADLLLEAMPRWGRLVLAGRAGAPMTFDVYRDVHLKGATVVALRLDPGLLFRPHPGLGRELTRAWRLLAATATRGAVQRTLE